MSQDSFNPYSAPESVSSPVDIQYDELKPCYSDRRLLNLFLDYAGYIVFSLLIGIVAGAIGGEAAANALNSIPGFILGFIIILIYYVLFEATTGRTPGKYLTGTKVVTLDGKKPSFGQIIIRTLCRFIPFEPFSCLGTYPRGWHDRISKTMVVRVKDLQN
jgi:uncharacterized RDD family membrane protein YckC